MNKPRITVERPENRNYAAGRWANYADALEAELVVVRERAERWFKAGVEAENKLADAEARLSRAAEALEPFTFPSLMFGKGQLSFDKVTVKVEVGDVKLAREVLAEQEKEQP